MGYNNTMYRLFKEMLDGYKTGNDGLFEHGARCIMDLNPANPFEENTPESECFFQMYNTYMRWKNHGADMKINRRRMLSAAEELCKIITKNPFTFSKEEEKKDLEELRKQEEEKKKQEELKKQREQEKLAQIKKQEELRIQEELKAQEEEKKLEIEKAIDSKAAMVAMVKAHNLEDDDAFRQAVIQLMDITTENPFAPRTDEYEKFLEMMTVYHKKPANMRRVLVVASQLCDIINYTEIDINAVKKETVLGVLPEDEKEKKNWLNFLFPWRKERE